MSNHIDIAKPLIEGFLYIEDADTGEMLVDKKNAIHFENMSLALAQSLGHKSEGPILSMAFGNGGATVSGIGTVTYLMPNTIGINAELYNETFSKIVDDNNISNSNPSLNKIEISHVTGNLFSDIIIYCLLDSGEPSGQDAFDNTNNIESAYVFDELGIKNYEGKLLTHVIFSPVQKSTNRRIRVRYTIRIQMI